ncbi:MAG: OstA-like protein [Tannerellaceae bacterium]
MLRFRFKYIFSGHNILLFGMLCLFGISHAQITDVVISGSDTTAVSADTIRSVDDLSERKTTKVFLEHADILEFNKQLRNEAKFLKGNVVFRHNESYMYCDSAYFFEQTNSLEAFSNVRMEQGDTLFIYGDYLFYDGDTEVAKLRNNVRMINKDVTLYTDSLNYDRYINIGYYFDHGRIVDPENILRSIYGQYSPDTKIAEFKDSVVLENPQFTLYSDTLKYNTDSKIATILGPSEIVSDSATIISSLGWYNTITNESMLLDQSVVVSGTKLLSGDSIFYNRELGFGEVFGNMSIKDTAQQVMLTGNYGYYNEKTQFAFATDSALLYEYSQQDTLFLHADTMTMVTIDEKFKEIKAYHGVRFFRPDLQGVCDSMQFNSKDSVLYMFQDPILWNETYQLSGDTIEVFLNDSTIDWAHVIASAFAIQEIDSVSYNQLGGSDLKAFFQNQTVERLEVSGNAESVYYPIDDKNGSFIGMNKTKSGYLTMWMRDSKLDKLKIWPSPQGTLTPIPDLTREARFLKNFQWFDYIRPINKEDLFRVVKRKVEEAPKRKRKSLN